ncbi:hypothetical protein AB0I94_32280 [Streptomyces sp. NPDC050147]|uniref:hypothetical protein n=1 Tax=Streptomyces sp. NPDC050147 TaxID=3155513 RepID=UPI00342B34EE
MPDAVLLGPLGLGVVSQTVRVLCRARSESKDQYALGCLGRWLPADLSDLLPAPVFEGGERRVIGLVGQGDAEGCLVVGEQAFLQTAGESAGLLVRMDEGFGDREDVSGRGELLEVLGQRTVKPLPPGAVARYGKSLRAAGQCFRLGDQHVESRLLYDVCQAVQELLSAVELLTGVNCGGFHVQVREVLSQVLGLPAVQPAQTHGVHGGRL